MDEQRNADRPQRSRRWLAAALLLLASCLLVGATAIVSGQWLAARLAESSRAQATPPPALPTVAQTAAAPVADEPAAPVTEEPAMPTAAPTQAASPLADSRIAFVDAAGRMGTVAAAGGDERLIGAEDAVLLFPAWSPDGRSLAAVGSTAEGPGVFAVADSDGAALTPLYVNRRGAPIYLYWSPDGQAVSFIANHDDGLALYLAPAQGGEEARLLATGSPFYWQWAEAGDELLIHSGASFPGARIAFLDVAAGGEPGDDLGAAGFFQAPGISAGGRYLAWAEVDNTRARWLVVRQTESGEEQRLPHRGNIAMSWSPAGDRDLLAFVSPAAANRRAFSYYGPLRLLDATSGEVGLLSDLTVLAFFWSPDGRYIAYITVAGQDDGEQAAGGLTTVSLTESEPAAQQGNLRLALWVVDVESGLGQQRLVFRPTAMYLTQFLPFFDQYALSHRIWSPDSAALVLPIAGDTPQEDTIYVVPAHAGAAYDVAKGTIAFWSP